MISRRKIVGIIALGTLLLALSVFSSLEYSKRSVPKAVVIDGEKYTLEIADTLEKRTKGLGARESLCATCAMLFVFPELGRYPFWMREMRFPLDIIWLKENKIVKIERNIPFSSDKIYVSEELADRVLELNAGETEGLKPGVNVQFIY